MPIEIDKIIVLPHNWRRICGQKIRRPVVVGALNPDGWTGDPTAGPIPSQLADDRIPLQNQKMKQTQFQIPKSGPVTIYLPQEE